MFRFGSFFIAGIVALMVGYVVLDHHQFKTSQDTFQAKVLNKERQCHWEEDTDSQGRSDGGHEECTNYVFTDQETLTNDGVVWAGRFSATDLQGKLVPGESYTFKVYGVANEKLGMYRKIIDVAKIIPGGGQTGGAGASNW